MTGSGRRAAAAVPIFLDDGGVISDNRQRGPQWRRLVGAFFAPRLGGSAEAWGHANGAFAEQLFEPAAWQARLASAPDYATYEQRYYLDWLRGMTDRLDIALPSSEAEQIALAREANFWITRRVRADFPGVVDAILTLHAAGHPLYTASGEASTDLTGYLGVLEVTHCFRRLYGPDLVGVLKFGPAYYEAIFADASLEPRDVLLVDDDPEAAAWASSVGATVVLVGEHGHRAPPGVTALGSLAELPGWLDSTSARR